MPQNLNLLPLPRKITPAEGNYLPRNNKLIALDPADPQALRSGALRLQQALARRGLDWELASGSLPADRVGVRLQLAPASITHPQGYELVIRPDGIGLRSHDPAGAFYGVCTLIQLLETNKTLPCLKIQDWPDFPARGVMLDVSRDKVPSMQTLLDLVDRLAGWKINQFQLYTEHTFAYRNHPEVWAKASPFTGQEILALDAYCRERFIQLVPNQNSFGHMHRWLNLPRYRPLAESPDGFVTPWGEKRTGPFSICPTDPASLKFIKSLYDELLPHFTSRQFNVGCDETFDLGQGRHRAQYQKRGIGRVYLDFLQKIHQEVSARGFRMQFWGDIIIQHPELVAELPKDSIALDWGYDADHPFDDHCARFAAAGLEFYVCPGTSSWCSIAGRTENALGNLRSAAQNGLKHGATGYLNTDWGDSGHWQTLPVSYLGFAAGAAYSWAFQANRDLPVASALSQHAFDDPSGNLGRVAYDLGNIYQPEGIAQGNGSALFYALQMPLPRAASWYGKAIPVERLHQALDAIDAAMDPLARTTSTRADLDLLRREFNLAARMLLHGSQRLLLAFDAPIKDGPTLATDMTDIIAEYQSVWLARNRPGGLPDSVARLEKAKKDYR
jgi:hexosaminidase